MSRTEHATLVLGLDYGTDSVRVLIADSQDGQTIASEVALYPRWAKGLYCDPGKQRFRQHPQDYLDAMITAVKGALAKAPAGTSDRIVGIGIDTTGSTPVAVDSTCTPLALRPDYAENPNAMFVLWKDHTAVAEAEAINEKAHDGLYTDYTRFVGSVYSSEWFWAKILHILRHDRSIGRNAHTWVEHCDWMPAVLAGCMDANSIKRSRCAAGHKAMWHPSWEGLPGEDFLGALDPRLKGLRKRLYRDTLTADQPAGKLSTVWAERLGLRPGIIIAAGAFDAHLGAVGAGCAPQTLVKVMGTSTCDMVVATPEEIGDRCIQGICGQVDGSILPGMIGLEAGQSAFGDVYAWFSRLLQWPLLSGIVPTMVMGKEQAASIQQSLSIGLLPALEAAAARLPPGANGVTGLDWFNGRRTPHADQRLQGAITHLNLGTDAPAIYRSLVEATAYGARAILDCFTTQGIEIRKVLAIGGIAHKSPLVMQICADVLERPIGVVASDQCCALGAAMFAATAAGLHRDIRLAQKAMDSGQSTTYRPKGVNVRVYKQLYASYQALAGHMVTHR